MWKGRAATIQWFRNGHNHDKKRNSNLIPPSFPPSLPWLRILLSCHSIGPVCFFLNSPSLILYMISGSPIRESLEWMWNGGITVCLFSELCDGFDALNYKHILPKSYACLLIKCLHFLVTCYFRLLSCLTEHLTAEIVQLTVSDITRAIEWMKCSYLYVRMKKACICVHLLYILDYHLTFN